MRSSLLLTQNNQFGEFTREPILTVACVLLIVVSIAWIIVSRMIARQLKRYEKAAAAGPRRKRPTSRSRVVWEDPPP